MKILIDRGHSYSAQGAVGYVKEVELTHKWGEAIYNKIKELGGDAVLLQDGATVSTDLSVPVKQANAFGKDCVFLSVHANSAADPSANGSEIFCYKGAYKGKTKELTDAVYNAYRSVVPDLRNRGVKQADYYVLRETVMPATLLELGFVGNNKDAVIISDPDVIGRGADAMARALMKVAGQQTTPAPAPQPDTTFKVQIIATALNYRQGPAVTYKINGVVKKNEVYTIISQNNGWGKLKSGAGWINLKYTKRV